MQFIPVMLKLNHYFSLQCHMILQKSYTTDELLKKHLQLLLLLLLLRLKRVNSNL